MKKVILIALLIGGGIAVTGCPKAPPTEVEVLTVDSTAIDTTVVDTLVTD